MRSITRPLRSLSDRRRWRRTRLPWAELEAEAARQGCAEADIFFDLAGGPRHCALPTADPLTRDAATRGRFETAMTEYTVVRDSLEGPR